MERTIENILQWGRDRKIIGNGTLRAQWKKIISEIGELADSLAKNEDIKDDIGDIFVVACMMAGINEIDIDKALRLSTAIASSEDDAMGVILHSALPLRFPGLCNEAALTDLVSGLLSMCLIKNVSFEECVNFAYNEIKDRRGYLNEQGVFVKEG